mmetsp:Transcript_25729/g.59760  ORF Transcript_25729/g.59760 Transcript_25729/m.59760 type:complete len:118 (-) Transcript_25729:148-501(-)
MDFVQAPNGPRFMQIYNSQRDAHTQITIRRKQTNSWPTTAHMHTHTPPQQQHSRKKLTVTDSPVSTSGISLSLEEISSARAMDGKTRDVTNATDATRLPIIFAGLAWSRDSLRKGTL